MKILLIDNGIVVAEIGEDKCWHHRKYDWSTILEILVRLTKKL